MERNNIRSAVDIVVPVYNGYDDLLLCIESLTRHTDLSRHRVILIDDCSPDERVRDLMREVGSSADENPDHGMVAVYNEKNRGFSANANTGLSWSDRDTILLNSDTIVTSGWVEKLQACALSSERIATVTPLSNAATLASVPVFLKDNPIPEGYTVDSYANLVERVSLHRYPRITVGVGFCMYIRQGAFSLVGPFDEKSFGRGYGEENDFCFRCSMLGLIHVLCDDTFIYHRGTASFETEEKRKLLDAHVRILRRRYPQFMEENDEYCRMDPDSEIRDNILLHQCLENGKKNLLYFLHLDFRQIALKNIGGTQLQVRDLTAGMLDDYNVFVCASDGGALRLTVYLKDEKLPEWSVLQSEDPALGKGKLITMKFPVGKGKEEPFPVFYDEQSYAVLSSILSSFSIDLVHVHHTQGLSLDIFRVCRNLEIPVIVTLHDYYYACPTTKLLQPSGQFCPMTDKFISKSSPLSRDIAMSEKGEELNSVSECQRHEVTESDADRTESDIKQCFTEEPFLRVPSEKTCARCLHINCGYGRVKVMERWRKENIRALDSCQKVIFPSLSARKTMCSVFPGLESKSMVIPHGSDLVSSGSFQVDAPSGIRKTDRMHARLDQMPGDGGSFHYIAGWAYLDGADSVDTSIMIEVTGADGKVFCMQVKKHARPDVAAATARPEYLWSGIHAVFQVPGLKEGRIRIRLLIREGDSVWTDGKSYRTSWNHARTGEGRLNVAYLGGVTKAKGSGVLKELIESGDRSCNLFVYGEVGDPQIQALEGRKHVFFSGVYQKDDIYDLLRASRIDVALILPVWGETFCYTLSEAWSLGIPVIGTDLGAVGERIRDTGAGWLLGPDASGRDVVKLLDEIRNHPDRLEKKRRKTAAISLRSISQMNEEYRRLYDSCLVPSKPVVVKNDRNMDPEFVFQALAMANAKVKGSGDAAQINRLREENEMLQESMQMLKNTTSYRMARKISEANIPFKEPLKKILKARKP